MTLQRLERVQSTVSLEAEASEATAICKLPVEVSSDCRAGGCGQDIMEGSGQEEFERANPLPDSFTNGSRAMLATFITTGCDMVCCQLAPIMDKYSAHSSSEAMHVPGVTWIGQNPF